MRYCRGGPKPMFRPVCPSTIPFFSFPFFFHNSPTEGCPPRDARNCVVRAQHAPAHGPAVVRAEAGPCRFPAEGVTSAGTSHRPAACEPRRGRFVVLSPMRSLSVPCCSLCSFRCAEKKNNANTLDDVLADLDSLAGLFRRLKVLSSVDVHGLCFLSLIRHPSQEAYFCTCPCTCSCTGTRACSGSCTSEGEEEDV